jgi:hypothetical protein
MYKVHVPLFSRLRYNSVSLGLFSMARMVFMSSQFETPLSFSMALIAWEEIVASNGGPLYNVLGLPIAMFLSI